MFHRRCADLFGHVLANLSKTLAGLLWWPTDMFTGWLRKHVWQVVCWPVWTCLISAIHLAQKICWCTENWVGPQLSGCELTLSCVSVTKLNASPVGIRAAEVLKARSGIGELPARLCHLWVPLKRLRVLRSQRWLLASCEIVCNLLQEL